MRLLKQREITILDAYDWRDRATGREYSYSVFCNAEEAARVSTITAPFRLANEVQTDPKHKATGGTRYKAATSV